METIKKKSFLKRDASLSILRADHPNQARRDSEPGCQSVYAGVVRYRAGDDTVPLGNTGATLPVDVDRLALELRADRPHDRGGDVFGLSNPGPVQGGPDRAFEVFGNHAELSHKTQKPAMGRVWICVGFSEADRAWLGYRFLASENPKPRGPLRVA